MNVETKTGILSILSGQDQDSCIMTRRLFRIEKWCLRELVLNAFMWALIFVKALPLSLGVLHIFIWMLEIHDFLIHTKEEESRLTGKSWKHIINWGTNVLNFNFSPIKKQSLFFKAIGLVYSASSLMPLHGGVIWCAFSKVRPKCQAHMFWKLMEKITYYFCFLFYCEAKFKVWFSSVCYLLSHFLMTIFVSYPM